MKSKNKDILKFSILILFIILIITLGFIFDIHKKFSIDSIKKFIEKIGIWGPLIYVFLYSITSIIFFPASVLSITSGAIWGEYIGSIYTVLGATIASSLPFYLSRYLGRGFVENKLLKYKKVNLCDNFISKNSFLSILIMRLIPFFPWDVVNFTSGLCGIKFRYYILATLIGTIPGSFMYNLIGSSLGKPLDIKKIIIIFSIGICIVIGTLIIKLRIKKKKKH
jgi:uncharacterized membrane protein YdjX (TVP38/TMEM64 family)